MCACACKCFDNKQAKNIINIYQKGHAKVHSQIQRVPKGKEIEEKQKTTLSY